MSSCSRAAPIPSTGVAGGHGLGVSGAGLPVPGPSDVVIQNRTGVLHEDLRRATLEALELGGEGCIAHARRYSWRRSAEAFATLIGPAGPSARSAPFG